MAQTILLCFHRQDMKVGRIEHFIEKSISIMTGRFGVIYDILTE